MSTVAVKDNKLLNISTDVRVVMIPSHAKSVILNYSSKSNLKLSEVKSLLALCKHNFRQVALSLKRLDQNMNSTSTIQRVSKSRLDLYRNSK